MGIKVVDNEPNVESKIGYYCIIENEPCLIVASIRFMIKENWNTATNVVYYAVMLGEGEVLLACCDIIYTYDEIVRSKCIPLYVDENGLKEKYRGSVVSKVKKLIKNVYNGKLRCLISPSMKYPEYDMWSKFYKDFIRNPEKCIIEII